MCGIIAIDKSCQRLGGEQMVKDGDVITLNKEEVMALIDRECRKRLHMSAAEFLKKRDNGGMPRSIAVHDIEMMLRLAR